MKELIRDKLSSTVKKNRLTHQIARYALNKYQLSSSKREFYRRITQLNADDYFDTFSKRDLNIIILTLDCLRDSQLSCSGYSRKTTPFLDSLGTKFTAVSASSWTYPSVASILTGLYPHNHNAIIGGKIKNFEKLENLHKIRGESLTLPEILFLSGYDIYFGTSIDMAFYPLKGRVIPQKRYNPSTRADEVLVDLTGWILKRDSPFFAYIQLGDLHEPLNPPEDFRNYFSSVKNLPEIDKWDFRRPEAQHGERFQEYKGNRILLYDNTLRYVDYAIEKFYNTCREKGLIDSTIFIITADHGEEFWEHAELEAGNFYDPRGYYGAGHGHSVFNEVIKVPLLIAGPSIPETESSHLVSTVDILPTLLGLAGIDYKLKIDGFNIWENSPSRHSPLLTEAAAVGYEKKALIVDRFKLVYSKHDTISWVFDLERDPQELNPIKDEGVVSVFLDKLYRLYADSEKRRVNELIDNKGLTNR